VRVLFLTDLSVTPLDRSDHGRRLWRLDAEFQCEVLGVRHCTISVPAGFVTDFASVPRLPLTWLLAGDVAHKSAVVHDYLYRTGGGPCGYDRAECDQVFLAGMVEEGVSAWRRRLMYWAVRAGGWRSYRGQADEHTGGV